MYVIEDNYIRASAQENLAKGGHSRKPNLPSFSVYREVLTSSQTSWGLFSKMRPIFGIIWDLDFRLTPEINLLTRENRPVEKSASRNQTC